MLPEKIKIGRVIYIVELNKLDLVSRGSWGECLAVPPKINIASETPCIGATVLDEICHAIENVFGIEFLPQDDKHIVFTQLLYMVLRENDLLNEKLYSDDRIEKDGDAIAALANKKADS